jgi:predicted metal-binding membrane protein
MSELIFTIPNMASSASQPHASALIERVLQRGGVVVSIALAVVSVLAWTYIGRLAADMNMSGMDMNGARMMSAGLRMVMVSAHDVWTAEDFTLMFVMWAVMMVGMMTPSVTPLVLLYARVAHDAKQQGRPFAAPAWIVTGYLVAWTGFAFLATLIQFLLDRAVLLTPSMALAASHFGGAVLIVAGLYQLTRLKRACLARCHSPLPFLVTQGSFRGEKSKSFALGVRHGLYCIGCCWAIMALLFVGGVMNLIWVAGITIFVLGEKVLPEHWKVPELTGGALLAAGI